MRCGPFGEGTRPKSGPFGNSYHRHWIPAADRLFVKASLLHHKMLHGAERLDGMCIGG
jgi:hypothetical protein